MDNELRCTFLINIDGTKLLVSVMDIAGEFVRSLARGTEDMIESMRRDMKQGTRILTIFGCSLIMRHWSIQQE